VKFAMSEVHEGHPYFGIIGFTLFAGANEMLQG
jgi:hypothetical protein